MEQVRHIFHKLRLLTAGENYNSGIGLCINTIGASNDSVSVKLANIAGQPEIFRIDIQGNITLKDAEIKTETIKSSAYIKMSRALALLLGIDIYIMSLNGKKIRAYRGNRTITYTWKGDTFNINLKDLVADLRGEYSSV